jgi:PAS domain S-box-containing protein
MNQETLLARIEAARQLFATAVVGMAINRPDGRFLAANPAYCRLVGYTESELQGLDIASITHADDLEHNKALFRELLAGERDHFVLDKRYINTEGRAVWSQVSATVWRDDSGAPVAVMGVAQDITPRKQAEAFASRVGQLGEMAMRGTPLPMVLESVVRLLEEQIPGALCSALLLDPSGQFLLHGAAPSLPAAYNAAVDGERIGEATGSCGTAAFRQERVIVPDIDTDPLWAHYRHLAQQHGLRACWSTPLVDARRKVLGTFAIYHREVHVPTPHELELVDTVTHLAGLIVERAAREQSLRVNEQIYRSLSDQNPDAVYSLDLQGNFLSVNDRVVEMSGYSREELLTMSFIPFLQPDDLPRVGALFERAVSGEPINYETVAVHRDGHPVHITVSNMPIVVEGKIVGIYGIAKDVSGRKLAEQDLKRAQRAIEMASRCHAALARAEDEQSLLKEVCAIAVQAGGSRLAWVGYKLDDEAKTVARKAFSAVEGGYLTGNPVSWSAEAPTGQLPVSRALRSGETVIARDLALDPTFAARRDAALERGFRSLIVLPLKEGGHTFGMLALFWAETGDVPARELSVLEELAGNLAYGISALRARARLREQATLMDKAHDAIVVRALDGTVTFWNKGAEKLYGWTAQEAVGRRVFLSRGDPGRYEAAMQTLLTRGEWNGELQHTTRSGQQLTVEAGWTLLPGPDGRKSIFTINTDVTERRRAEREIARTHRALQMLSRSNDVLVRSEIEGDLLQQVCQVAIDVGGYFLAWVGYALDDARKSVAIQRFAGERVDYIDTIHVTWSDTDPSGSGAVGQTIREGRAVVRKDILEQRDTRWDAAIERGFRSAICLPLRDGATTLGVLMLYRTEVLDLPPGEMSLLQELADNLAFGITTLRDREALRQSDAKYRALFSGNPQPIGVYDPQTLRFIAVNPAAVAFYGYSEAELLDMGVAQLLSAGSLEPWMRSALTGSFEEPRTLEWPQRKKNGDLITVEATVNSMLFEGRPARLMLVNDVTERRRAANEIARLTAQLEDRVRRRTAQLEAVNKELEAFSYSVAHDIRQPLSSVSGFSHMLEKAVGEAASDSARHYLARIQAGVKQMGDMTDALLTLAQLSRASLKWEPVDLGAMARDVVHSCRERDPDRVAEITVAPDLVAQGDPRLLQQVVQNLLLNAWKFTARHPSPRIEFGRQVTADGETEFFVRDNGAGFDMAYADKLFGAFQRLHSPSEFTGSGIGLANVKRIVNRHGGQIRGVSAPGEGATFYFTLGNAPL